MNRDLIANILATVWLVVWMYDLSFQLPEYLHPFVALGWGATMFASLKWKFIDTKNIYLKLVSLGVLAFVILISFGAALDYLAGISPKLEDRNHAIMLLLLQSIAASIFTAVVVFLPLISIYQRNLFVIVLLASLPTILIHCHGIYFSESLITKLILGLEILFMQLVIWIVCKIACKVRTNHCSRTSYSAL